MKTFYLNEVVAVIRSYRAGPWLSASSSQEALELLMRHIPKENQHDALIALHGYRNQLLAEVELALTVQSRGLSDEPDPEE